MFYTALGASYSMSTPWGTKSINVPVEQIAKNAAEAGLQAAWPPLESRLNKALPSLVGKAMDEAIPAFEAELPGLMRQASKEVQPELRKEIDRALEIGTRRGATIATGIAVVMIATSWLTW
jgi:hypothetical protein